MGRQNRRPPGGERPHHRRGQPAPPPRQKKSMSPLTVLIIVLFFAFVISYMGRGLHNFLTPNVNTLTLRLSNMEMQQSVPGMIVRHEEVYRANRGGRVVFAVNEFEHIREGTAVASIGDIEAAIQNEEELERLQQEIVNVHEMRHATRTDPFVQQLNANLQQRMNLNLHHYMQMNLAEIYTLLDTFTQITNNRNDAITEESVHLRADLSNTYNFLAYRRGTNISNIYATRTGIMSPIIDGFEERFTPHNMLMLSREEVRMSVDHEIIVPGHEISEGDVVFKIVRNTWYIASWMPNEMAESFTIGSDRHIYLENIATGRFERMPVRVTHIDRQRNDSFVIFRSTRHVMDFLGQRNVNIRITDNIQNGFMIPTSAIATRRFFRIPLSYIHGIDEHFVMHRRPDATWQPVLIEIYEMTDDYAFILEDMANFLIDDQLSPVDPNDLFYIINENSISIVRGVYTTTLGYANFRTIDIEGEFPEAGGQVLLNPSRNPSIRQFDPIVIDAAMVRQGQVIR